MPVKIFIGNLNVDSTPETEAELRGLFEQFGTVTECSILTGKSYGFVHMTSEEDANIAIAGLNGHEFQQCALNVELSDNQSGRRGGGGGGGRGRDDRRGGRGRDRGGRGRGGDRGRRGGGRDYGRDRYEPYGRSERYNDYDPYGRDDPYGDYPPPRRPLRDPYDDPYYRDPYSRDPYADPYLRDPYSRDPYARDPYSRDPYPSRDPYARPPPDYYSRLRDPYDVPPRRDPYGYDRGGPGGGRDEELVSYPPPRATNATNGYSKD